MKAFINSEGNLQIVATSDKEATDLFRFIKNHMKFDSEKKGYFSAKSIVTKQNYGK